MILTEKEAATKACVREPHASHSGGIPTFPCRGSLCMAWRQESDGNQKVFVGTTHRKDDGTLEHLSRKSKNAPSDPGWAPLQKHEDDGGEIYGYVRSGTPRGYCGLARTP